MELSKRTVQPFLGMIAAALFLLSLSAFTFPPASARANRQVTSQQTGYKVLPGQEISIPAPTKDDPKFTIHLKLSQSTPVSFSDLNPVERIGLQLPSSTPCKPVWSQEAGTDAFGLVVWSYSVSFTFCYENNIVTLISSMHPSISTIIGWGVSHQEYSSEYRTWGDGGGDYNASSFLQSHSGFVQVNVFGNGNYQGFGA